MSAANVLLGILIAAIAACHGAYGWLRSLPSAPAPELLEAAAAFFAQAQIVLSFGALACFLARRWKGWWLPAFMGVYALALSVETLGVRGGFPFGSYAFTDMLGPRLNGVPLLIPLSWFNIAWPAWALASAVFPGRTFYRAALTAFLALAWDLSIDPVMSHLYPFWTWVEGGAYYGVPVSNMSGWLLVGGAAALLLDRAAAPIEHGREDLRWLAAHYAVSVLMPLGLATLSGLWLAVAASLVALVVLARIVGPELAPAQVL